MINSTFEMAPSVKKSDILCVYSDEFLTDEVLEKTGLGHAALFYDHHHLDLNFQKKLGNFYPQAKPFLASL